MRGSTEQRGTQQTETHTTRRRPKSETETSLRRWRVRLATWTCERETRVEPRAEEEIQAHAAMNQQVRDEKKKGREPVGPQKSEPMRTAQDGREPSWKDREHHEATGHVVHAEWCRRCVCVDAVRAVITSTTEERTMKTQYPAMGQDSCFREGCTRNVRGFGSVMEALVMTDHHSRAQLARDLKTDIKWRRQDLQGHSRVSARAWVRQSGPKWCHL